MGTRVVLTVEVSHRDLQVDFVLDQGAAATWTVVVPFQG